MVLLILPKTKICRQPHFKAHLIHNLHKTFLFSHSHPDVKMLTRAALIWAVATRCNCLSCGEGKAVAAGNRDDEIQGIQVIVG